MQFKKRKKIAFLILIVFFVNTLAKAQNEDTPANKDEVLMVVEKMPEFPVGENALRLFIAINVEYPIGAQEKEIQGTVYIRFVVTKTGEIGEVVIMRGVDPLLDNAAIKVVKTLPKFSPGYQKGKAVNVWYTVPITFQLSTN